METSIEGAAGAGTDDQGRANGRGLAIAAALATLGVSTAMGSLATRRWRRAAFWLATEVAWYAGAIWAIHAARPRAAWIEISWCGGGG